jgi:3-oxoacyl-[acyl-carrier protein] reductase
MGAQMFAVDCLSVLVTGGSKGIGRGIAAVFAGAGANVAIAARSAPEIDSAVAELDTLGAGKVLGLTADVSDRSSCATMAASVIESFGGLDVVCANAGIFPE